MYKIYLNINIQPISVHTCQSIRGTNLRYEGLLNVPYGFFEHLIFSIINIYFLTIKKAAKMYLELYNDELKNGQSVWIRPRCTQILGSISIGKSTTSLKGRSVANGTYSKISKLAPYSNWPRSPLPAAHNRSLRGHLSAQYSNVHITM